LNAAPEPTNDGNPVVQLGTAAAVLVGSLVGLLYFADVAIFNPPPPRAVTFLWDNTDNVRGSFTKEVWSSTNLTAWQLKTNLTGTNRVTLPADKAREFFKIRNKGTNGLSSDWSRKPTL
jgi:hypothetical protein